MFGFFKKNKQQTIITLNEFRGYFNEFFSDEHEEQFLNEVYKNPFTSAGITRINEAFNNLIWGTYKTSYKDNKTEVKDSFVSRTIKNPSNLLNIDQFISYFALYYLIYGELLVMRMDLFTKSEIVLLKKGAYSIEYDHTNVLNGIKKIRVGMNEYTGDDLKQFHYIKSVNIYDNIAGAGLGVSKVKSLAMLHAYYCYITAWNVGILKNGGKREIIALVKSFMNPQKKKELEEKIKSKSGANNVGVPLILEGSEMDIKTGDFSPKEFDFLQALDEIRNITASVLNVPSILIGDRTNSKFSNYKEAKKDLYTENIIPFAQQICEYLNRIFKDKLGNNEFIEFDASTIEVLKEDKKEVMAMLNSITYLTINEKRAELEYPPVEFGDEILLDGMKTPLKDIFEEEKPVEEQGDEEENEERADENTEENTGEKTTENEKQTDT